MQELLNYKSDFNQPKNFNKTSQPKQSQMCHVLGEVVKRAGISSERSNSNKRGVSNHLYNSQIILGSDKDYMEKSSYQRNYNQTNSVGKLLIDFIETNPVQAQ